MNHLDPEAFVREQGYSPRKAIATAEMVCVMYMVQRATPEQAAWRWVQYVSTSPPRPAAPCSG